MTKKRESRSALGVSPVEGHEFGECPDDGVGPLAKDLGVGVSGVDLEQEFSAGAAGREQAVCADGDESDDVAFAVGEHGADGVSFGAEAEGAGGVEADSGVDASGGGEERGGDLAGLGGVGETAWVECGGSGGDEFVPAADGGGGVESGGAAAGFGDVSEEVEAVAFVVAAVVSDEMEPVEAEDGALAAGVFEE